MKFYTVLYGNTEIVEEHEEFVQYAAMSEEEAITRAQFAYLQGAFEADMLPPEKITMHGTAAAGYEVEIVHDEEFSESVWFSARAEKE